MIPIVEAWWYDTCLLQQINTEKVELEGLLIPVILTNKYTLLQLAALPMIDGFDYMIKQNDLKVLCLDRITFNFGSISGVTPSEDIDLNVLSQPFSLQSCLKYLLLSVAKK